MEPNDEIHRLRAIHERNIVFDRAYADGIIPINIPILRKFQIREEPTD